MFMKQSERKEYAPTGSKYIPLIVGPMIIEKVINEETLKFNCTKYVSLFRTIFLPLTSYKLSLNGMPKSILLASIDKK